MNLKQMKEHIDASVNNGQIYTVAAGFFLAVIVLINQISHFAVIGIYYLCALFAFVVWLYGDGKKLEVPKQIAIFAVLIMLTGLINIVHPGNSTLNKHLFTVVSVGIALVFLDKRTDERVFLYMFLINALVVLVRILVGGPKGTIYVSSSANFVSVHLLCPLVLYYSETERREKKLLLWPVAVAWVMCLVARGRAGILFCSFLLLGLIVVRVLPVFLRLNKRKKLTCGAVLVGILVLAVILMVKGDLMHKIPVLEKFARFGMSGTGRGNIWGEYLRRTFAAFESTVFAPALKNVQYAVKHGGNLHNSFLNIHAYNGLIMFVVVIAMCVYAAINGMKNRKWVYLICFATFCMRGFTDYVFWGSTGTPFLFYFLFMPYVTRRSNPAWVIDYKKFFALIMNKKAPAVVDQGVKEQLIQKEEKNEEIKIT